MLGTVYSNLLQLRYYILWIILVAFDQVTKWYFELTVGFYNKIVIIPERLIFELVHNYGAAYGILQNQKFFLLTVSGAVVIGGLIFAKKIIQSQYSCIGLMFLLAGALGNFLDRAILGYVIDFINIRIFPVFNLADVFINIGVALFVIEMMVSEKNKTNV